MGGDRFVVDRNVGVRMRDGVILRGDVYRPLNDEPVPAVLNITPYNKEWLAGREDPMEPVFSAPDRGFAYVRIDCRGRYASAGDYEPYGPVEAPDAYDCVEWVAAQDWCSGAVGMLGVSYEAGIQLQAAAMRPPHLRAIAPIMGGTWQFGFTILDFSIFWCAMMAADSLKRVPPSTDREHDERVIFEALRDPADVARHLPLNEHPLANLRTISAPSFLELWEPGRVTQAAADGLVERFETVPGLFLTGWYDCGAASIVEQWRSVRRDGETSQVRSETILVLGPWRHGKNITEDLGDVHFGFFAAPMTSLSSGDTDAWWTVEEHYWRFFSQQLQGHAGPTLAPVNYFMMGSNTWRTAETWPPPDTIQRTLYLHSGGSANSSAGDGLLSWAPPKSNRSSDAYDYDPLNPVPSFGGRFFHRGGSAGGPFDQARVERRRDVLVYTSEPLSDVLEIAGDVELDIYISSTAPDTDFMVKLCAVDQDGISINIADGQIRARYRSGLTPSFLDPDETYKLTVDLGPTAYTFKPGHRLRVQVTSSAFPFYDRNMNTGGDLSGEESTSVVARQTVHHNATAPSHIRLPVRTH